MPNVTSKLYILQVYSQLLITEKTFHCIIVVKCLFLTFGNFAECCLYNACALVPQSSSAVNFLDFTTFSQLSRFFLP